MRTPDRGNRGPHPEQRTDGKENAESTEAEILTEPCVEPQTSCPGGLLVVIMAVHGDGGTCCMSRGAGGFCGGPSRELLVGHGDGGL